VILNSIPLATNPNGALLLTWLLDTSNFPSRYTLLAPRFTPHLSHLCTHKLASLTVLRLVNQKVEPAASALVIEGLFSSPNDHVLTDVLGDQVNGVSVVHKMLTSPFLVGEQKERCIESTKRVLIELKVIATQAYRRLIEEVGLPVPSFQGSYASPLAAQEYVPSRAGGAYNPGQSPGANEVAPLIGNMHLHGNANFASPVPFHAQRSHSFPPEYVDQAPRGRNPGSFSPAMDPFNPFGLRSPELSPITRHAPLENFPPGSLSPPPVPYSNQAPSLAQAGNILGMSQPNYNMPPVLPPHVYQAYYQMYQQQNPQNMGGFQ
jgi:protein JSN1